MPVINRSALLPYSASQMYQLVNAVEDYPEFLPWCENSVILSQNEDEIHACLSLSAGGLRKSFTTCNRLQKDKMIEIRLVDGPFRQLEGFWRFTALSAEACKVNLDLEFEFSNKLIALAFGSVFNRIAETLVDAFSKRAREVYGERAVHES
jgi:ribosome-associated toxin RatA of RatAB toxin-antitoxin module